MTSTTRLSLPLLDAAQAQKHVTHNEALIALDSLVHLAVKARDVNAAPAAPAEGDAYLVGASPSGAFAGHANCVAAFDSGGWEFRAPRAGFRVFVESGGLLLLFDGTAWIDMGLALRRLADLERLGLGATADAINPLTVRANGVLFAARKVSEGGAGDMRFTLNKEAAAKTVSQLYQSNWSGRAETGLTGDDDFHVKVSPDGVSWKEALVVDRATGMVAFPSGGPANVRTFAASGTYTPTPGVKFVEVFLFGAGGGGGSGARQASGAIASGGGGGGGGGRTNLIFTAAQVGASQLVTIGAGGYGGAAQTVNGAAGNNGSQGGGTTFGSLARAGGGGGGAGGGLGVGSGGGGGGGPSANGWNASGATGGQGFAGVFGSGGNAANGGTMFYSGHASAGGGGGGAPATGAAGTYGGHVFVGAGGSGGGSGGGITAANAVSGGGGSGQVYGFPSTLAAAAGAAGDGSNGQSPPSSVLAAGTGGAGGGSSLTVAGNGGAGGYPSGGGGGGGALRNGGSGGAGGIGSDGYAVIIEFF